MIKKFKIIKIKLKKDPFKEQERPMDFNETENKRFIDMVSNFVSQLTFQKFPLNFGFSVIFRKKISIAV